MNIHKIRAHDVAITFYAILQCTTLAFTISLDSIGCVISQKNSMGYMTKQTASEH